MSGSNIKSGDEMIRRLETELREKQTVCQEIIHRAQTSERDLNEDEKVMLSEYRGRMEKIKDQLDTVEDVARVSHESVERARRVGDAIESMRGKRQAGPVEYRTAGEYALDMYRSALGNRESRERMEMFFREAEHQKTEDNLGVIPDPVIGEVINFIDAARPIVSALGPRPMPSSTWHRPKVTQHTKVATQGTTGLHAEEKTELESQKMTITRLNCEAVTYGGYVNVSRQNIDFSQPQILDIIIQDLAAQYAIETEAATGAALAANNGADVTYTPGATAAESQANAAAAVWEASALCYSAVRGQGRLVLVVSPEVLSVFGPLFAPYGPNNQFGTGFNAGGFGQGAMGSISGVSVVMSSGLGSGEAFLLSTAAVECYEQRVGTLQVTEPSVLGVQIAYAGYFTPLIVNDDGVIPIIGAGS